jgi:hypothetical protein
MPLRTLRASSVAARVVGRGFGGRDLTLAVGTLITLKDERRCDLAQGGALSDAADAVSTLVAFRKLGSVRWLLGGRPPVQPRWA